MNEYERRVLEDLSVLKAQMHQLMGIGQPGRLAQLEERVDAHDHSMQRIKGLAGAFGGLLTALHAAIAFVGGRH